MSTEEEWKDSEDNPFIELAKKVYQLEKRLDSIVFSIESQLEAMAILHSACTKMDKNMLNLLTRVHMQELEIERLRHELIQCSQIN